MSLEHLTPLVFPVDTVLGDVVYRVLGEAIADGRLHPGLQLRDVDVAKRLGISRTPVREALQRLEHIGLVDIAPNRYTRVSIPTDRARDDSRELVVHAMCAALRMALSRCTDAELATLLEHLDQVVAASALSDAEALADSNRAFFSCLTSLTQNSIFIDVLAQASLTLRRNLKGWHPDISDPHLRAAIAARDADAAEHLLRTRHGCL